VLQGDLASTFTYFPFTARDSTAAGLFALVLILSTLALDVVTITATVVAVFDTTNPEGATTLRGMLVPGTTPTFDACIVWVALAETVFDGAALTPFAATYAIVGITFQPDTLTHFPEGPSPASLFLFFVASSHASESG
jgi:hypothetical protein